MKPIRILHIVSDINISGGVMGIIMNLYRHIDKRKVQFDFMYFEKWDIEKTYENEILNMGGCVYCTPRPTKLIKFMKYLEKFFVNNAYKYNAIHLHEVYLNMFIAPSAHRYGIHKIISHSHTTQYSDKILNSIRNRILCLPLKKTTNVHFACSKVAGEFLYGKKLIEQKKVYIINNAVECDKYRYNKTVRRQVRSELGIGDKCAIGHIGRFSEQKNHNLLIDIFSEIKKINNDSILVLVGEGPLFESIKMKITKLKLDDDVILLGQRNDVERILQGIDVFVLPSLYEGLPVIGVEAQASGLPCFMADTITKEVDINDVQYFSLNEDLKELANKIVEYYYKFVRKDVINKVKLLGFDIHIEASKVEEFYVRLNYNKKC